MLIYNTAVKIYKGAKNTPSIYLSFDILSQVRILQFNEYLSILNKYALNLCTNLVCIASSCSSSCLRWWC